MRIALYPLITSLLTWIFTQTNGSIPAPAVFHTSMNPLMGILPISMAVNVLLIDLAVAVLVTKRMWRRLPADHPAVYLEIAL